MTRTSSIAPLWAISSLILSMFVAALGNGMMFAYVPFALAARGAPPWVAGAVVTGIAFGGLIGCLIAGPLIRAVGHARIFACCIALAILSVTIIAADAPAFAWVGSRVIYGIAANGFFIVTQSWINHVTDNSFRGRAMSALYMAYILGLGSGAFIFGQLPLEGNIVAVVAIAFGALAILPIGLTRLPTPPPPEAARIDLAGTWRASPVATVGVVASGGLSMLVAGFTPIYLAGEGVPQKDVALTMFLTEVGMIFVMYPLGMLSDRIDRRIVLAFCGVAAAAVAFGVANMPLGQILLLAALLALWSGVTETVYSVANAHANDRAKSDDYITLASTMLILWSSSAFVAPLAVTAMTPVFGPKTYMLVVALIGVAFSVFAVLRIATRKPTPPQQVEPIELVGAQAPNASNLLPNDPEPDGLPMATVSR